MKKLMLLISVLIFTMTMIAGCGGSKSTGTETKNEPKNEAIIGCTLTEFEKVYGKGDANGSWSIYKDGAIRVKPGNKGDVRTIIIEKKANLDPSKFIPSDAKEVDGKAAFKQRYGEGKYYTSEILSKKYKTHAKGFHFMVSNKRNDGSYAIVGGYEYNDSQKPTSTKAKAAPQDNSYLGKIKAMEKEYRAEPGIWHADDLLIDGDNNKVKISINTNSSYNKLDGGFDKGSKGYVISGYINGQAFKAVRSGEALDTDLGVPMNAPLMETLDKIGNDLHTYHVAELAATSLNGTTLSKNWITVEQGVSFHKISPREAYVKFVRNNNVIVYRLLFLDHKSYSIEETIYSSSKAFKEQMNKEVPGITDVPKCDRYPVIAKIQVMGKFQGQD